MKLAFTGTKLGMKPAQKDGVRRELYRLLPNEAHHGLCVGADHDFHLLIRELFERCRIIGHPSLYRNNLMKLICDEMRPPADYLVRDKHIVAEGEHLLATPFCPEVIRSGTWTTVRYGRRRGLPVTIVWPDGSVTLERQ